MLFGAVRSIACSGENPMAPFCLTLKVETRLITGTSVPPIRRKGIGGKENMEKTSMKIKRLIAVTSVGVVLLGLAGVAKAAVHIWEDPGAWSSGVFAYDAAATPKFTANELSLDMFASFVAPERRFRDIFDTNIRHGKWGGGVGVNYFFTRELGIMGDINIGDNGGNFVDQVMGAGVLRIPLEPTGLAPYIFGGGGRGTDPVWEWLGQAGVGLEYRLNPATGLFADARYIWHDKSFDRLMIRTGLRLVF